ncbi:MAG: HIT family protein [Hydrotalea flava]|uniref:HIT family protein n=1 Tax=Hydrotalea sp. TaxID=2881279 RepID=UPI00258CB965|nr:HIT family protein [Hydrotalea sp.]MBY0346895.1 HIT family protein [Hydrotalea flava]
MQDCPFCNKQKNDFYLETENFAVIYNISPILPGHSLVIPKQHKESLFELTDDELAKFMQLGRTTAALLCKVFNTNAFNWAIQEREVAGQSVAHLHMHVVPRRLGDMVNPGDWYQRLEKIESGDIDTYERFRLSEEVLHTLTQKMKQKAIAFGLRK